MKSSVICDLQSKHYRSFRVDGVRYRAMWCGYGHLWSVAGDGRMLDNIQASEHATARKIAEAAGLA